MTRRRYVATTNVGATTAGALVPVSVYAVTPWLGVLLGQTATSSATFLAMSSMESSSVLMPLREPSNGLMARISS